MSEKPATDRPHSTARQQRGPERTWRAFEANEITHSGAHYLLAVATFTKSGRAPRAADIARHLGISRAATSAQLRSLQEHGLVELDREQRLHLTRAGADLVARVAGKREVLRVFFREILALRPEIAELDACKVEHLLSEETGAALVRLIRFLRSDHAAATACMQVFAETTSGCPEDGNCELCDRICLLSVGSPS